MMGFADKLRELRLKNRLTQEALAAKLYVSRQAVTKWEGAKGLPDEETIEKIAALFNVDKEYFFKDEEKNKPRISRLKIALITIIALLLLSIAYVIIHFVIIVPILIRNGNEIERQKRIEVAAYLSLEKEDLSLDAIKASTNPYIINIDNEIFENRLYKASDNEYVFYVPYDLDFNIYLNKLIYNAIDKEYKTESTLIEEYGFAFDLKDNIVRVERMMPTVWMTIYSYDARLKLIREETFSRDIDGNIYSNLNGRLNKPYLDCYHVDGAFQYSITLRDFNNHAEVATITSSKRLVTFLIPDDWFSASYSFETEFII